MSNIITNLIKSAVTAIIQIKINNYYISNLKNQYLISIKY